MPLIGMGKRHIPPCELYGYSVYHPTNLLFVLSMTNTFERGDKIGDNLAHVNMHIEYCHMYHLLASLAQKSPFQKAGHSLPSSSVYL